ncbi:UNVERIFIED_ORG: transposase-like protein [Rhizobium etli]
MKCPLNGGGRQEIEGDEEKLVIRRILRNGRRRYEAASKARLVAASLEPGVSVSGLALNNGVNANLLRKWIKQAKEAGREHRPSASAFVPVVAAECSLSTALTAQHGAKRLAKPERTVPLSSHQMHRMGEAVTEQLHMEVKAKRRPTAFAAFASFIAFPSSTPLRNGSSIKAVRQRDASRPPMCDRDGVAMSGEVIVFPSLSCRIRAKLLRRRCDRIKPSSWSSTFSRC